MIWDMYDVVYFLRCGIMEGMLLMDISLEFSEFPNYEEGLSWRIER